MFNFLSDLKLPADLVLAVICGVLVGAFITYFIVRAKTRGFPKTNLKAKAKPIPISNLFIGKEFIEFKLVKSGKYVQLLKGAFKSTHTLLPPDINAILMTKEKIADADMYQVVKRFELINTGEQKKKKVKEKDLPIDSKA